MGSCNTCKCSANFVGALFDMVCFLFFSSQFSLDDLEYSTKMEPSAIVNILKINYNGIMTSVILTFSRDDIKYTIYMMLPNNE